LGIKNIIRGPVKDVLIVSGDGAIAIDAKKEESEGERFLIMRSEALQVASGNIQAPGNAIRMRGRVLKVKFLHGFYTALVQSGNHELECHLFRGQSEELEAGQDVEVFFSEHDARFVKR